MPKNSAKFGGRFLAQNDLLERGWSAASIRDLLGEPDHISRIMTQHRANDRYEYDPKRVFDVERMVARLAGRLKPDRPMSPQKVEKWREERIEALARCSNDPRYGP